MRSPHNPNAGQISEWAWDVSAHEPVQDWDLILSHCPYEQLYMKLASAVDCPKREYFLSLLYLIVGDAVRTNYQTRSRRDVERLLIEAEQKFSAYSIHLWTKRARELISAPQSFRYDDWCGGFLAKENNG